MYIWKKDLPMHVMNYYQKENKNQQKIFPSKRTTHNKGSKNENENLASKLKTSIGINNAHQIKGKFCFIFFLFCSESSIHIEKRHIARIRNQNVSSNRFMVMEYVSKINVSTNFSFLLIVNNNKITKKRKTANTIKVNRYWHCMFCLRFYETKIIITNEKKRGKRNSKRSVKS